MSKERRKVRTGRVVSDKMDKTVVVAVQWSQRNRLYRKPMRRITKFYAHDAANDCSTGDLVLIEETRPISSQKNWRVIDVLERREVAEIRPMELDRAFMESQMRGQDAEAEEGSDTAVAIVDEPDPVDAEALAEAEALALEDALAEMDALEVDEDDATEIGSPEESQEPTALDADEELPAEMDAPEEPQEPTALDEPEETPTAEATETGAPEEQKQP